MTGAGCLAAATSADAQGNYTPPRTPWSDPDIQGTFTSDDSINVGIERRPEFGDRLFLNEEEYNEMVHEARIIPLDQSPYVGEDIRMYMGDSRGHWDGDTLVVETRNLTDKTGVAVNGGGNRHSKDMILTERVTRTAPDRLYYEATFDDPNAWTAPWTVGFPIIEKPTYAVFEYACHEGNNAMFNMLSGARADDAAAASEEN